MSDTIFGKIVSGEIPSEFLYEDEHCIAINDINPQAPVHVLVIPKRGIPRLVDAQRTTRPCWDTCCWPRARWRSNWAWTMRFA